MLEIPESDDHNDGDDNCGGGVAVTNDEDGDDAVDGAVEDFSTTGS